MHFDLEQIDYTAQLDTLKHKGKVRMLVKKMLKNTVILKEKTLHKTLTTIV